MLNPGEAFAEIYRVLNERLAGLTEAPWDVVSQSLYPVNVALSLLQQDVVSPWTTNTMQTRTASFAKQGTATRSFTFSTPLDGTLKVSLSHARGLGTALAVSKGGTRAAASSTVCGTRSVRVTVTRKSGSGSFKLSASTA